jgi:hypothetical protein
VGILYSVGPRTPFFRFLYALVPGVSSFRFPGRVGLIVTLAVLLGAGLFLSELRPRRSALAACGAGGALVLFAIARLTPSPSAEEPRAARLVLCLLAAAGAVLLIAWHRGGGFASRARRPMLVALVAVAAAEIALTSVVHRPFRAGLRPFPAERLVAAELARLRVWLPPFKASAIVLACGQSCQRDVPKSGGRQGSDSSVGGQFSNSFRGHWVRASVSQSRFSNLRGGSCGSIRQINQ